MAKSEDDVKKKANVAYILKSALDFMILFGLGNKTKVIIGADAHKLELLVDSNVYKLQDLAKE